MRARPDQSSSPARGPHGLDSVASGAATSSIVHTEPRRLVLREAIASQFAAFSKEQLGRPLRGAVRGAIYSADGKLQPLSQRRPAGSPGPRICIDPRMIEVSDPAIAGAERVGGRTLYLGNFMNHYGHFLTEFLSRLWILEEDAGFDCFVAYPSTANRGRYLPKDFHRDLCGQVGLDLERLKILHAPARFAELVVPEQLWILNTQVNGRLRGLYERIAQAHRNGDPAGRVFLSRSPRVDQRLANTSQIERVFAGFGFSVVYPEELAMSDQLRLYANCEILAGLSGSGMHNALFCPPGTPVIEVGDLRARRHPPSMQQMANQLAQVRSSFMRYRGSADGRTDIEALAANLSGLLGERPRPERAVWLSLRQGARWLARPALRVWRRHRRG